MCLTEITSHYSTLYLADYRPKNMFNKRLKRNTVYMSTKRLKITVYDKKIFSEFDIWNTKVFDMSH